MSEQKVLRKEIEVGGRPMILETGRLAKQASGAVLVHYGDTRVLVSATVAKGIREGIDFFPLTVDYEERLYAVGRIPGGFIKRESRPSEKAVLSSRLIDRPIRPLFPKSFRNEVQVIATVLSVDQDNAPEIAAMVGASAALHLSQAPFNGPIGGVILGLVDGQLIINPSVAEAEKSQMHLVVAGTKEAVMMVECRAKEVPEEQMLEAIAHGHAKIQEIVAAIEDFRQEALELGLAQEKIVVEEFEPEADLKEQVSALTKTKVWETIAFCVANKASKKEREQYFDDIRAEILEAFAETYPEQEEAILAVYDKVEKAVFRNYILENRVRVDGRALDEVRPISVEAGVLPRTHGTGLFTRGQTQVLSVLTLGAISDEQRIDGLGLEETKRYMHHYNFPPYSTGETRPMRSPGRREVGHGALAEKALEAVIPSETEFPYTIRIVSEVLESNGSSSMGSVCGSCLSLMDAGVPIKAPVAGAAMGLIKEGEQVAILTDIQGVEDHLGDMDFKVAGTKQGITALQMDIKIAGVTTEILRQALAQANGARMFIMGKMLEVLPAPRTELSPYAPRIIHTQIDPDKIRDVIGPGGKIIRKIVEETGANIDIEDDGRVFISSVDAQKGQNALEIIETLTKDVETGQIYNGKVTRVTDFGCFVEVIPGIFGVPGKEGLVHISQLDHSRVAKTEDIVQEGDPILVKAIGYDDHGRLKLSRKEAIPNPNPNPNPPEERREKRERSDRDNNGKGRYNRPKK